MTLIAVSKTVTAAAIEPVIAAGGVTFPEPDVTNCGGVTVFMKVAHLAEAFNLPVTSHGAHDVTVHLLAAAPNRSYLEAHGFGLDRYIESYRVWPQPRTEEVSAHAAAMALIASSPTACP